MTNIIKKAAIEAGKILLENFGKITASDIKEKQHNDFLTFVDEKSEEKIIEIIHSEYPDHAIYAEESGEIKNQSNYRWIIDPLDGTKNFICGIPVFAVSIALEIKKEITYSVVYDVMHNSLFYAEKGKGAYLNDTRILVSDRTIEQSLLATGFPFKKKQYLPQYLKCFERMFDSCSGIRRMGAAAIDLAYVAAGRFEGFWELGLQPWDMAGGSLLITEAGGKVTDFWGMPEHMENSFLVASNNLIHDQLIEITSKLFSINLPSITNIKK